jgi:hypothetical protein
METELLKEVERLDLAGLLIALFPFFDTFQPKYITQDDSDATFLQYSQELIKTFQKEKKLLKRLDELKEGAHRYMRKLMKHFNDPVRAQNFKYIYARFNHTVDFLEAIVEKRFVFYPSRHGNILYMNHAILIALFQQIKRIS